MKRYFEMSQATLISYKALTATAIIPLLADSEVTGSTTRRRFKFSLHPATRAMLGGSGIPY
jgi:hypothetical protein